MSNELIGKNIGHATAYAYAKAHGYEGTEEDFAQMLANYDTLVEQASGYAESAGKSASEASGYADDASASATAADQAVQRISGITASTTVAGMTDTTKVYVYLGSETGYTSGNWYYYSGSAWVSGGVYQSTALVTDTTLTQSGMAADAKATGDEVADLKSAITDLNDGAMTFGYYASFVRGGLSNGVVVPSQNYRVTTDTIITLERGITLNIANGFKIAIHYFSGSTYSSGTGWRTTRFYIPKGTSFKILIAKVSETSTPANVGEFVGAITFTSDIEETALNVNENSEITDSVAYLKKWTPTLNVRNFANGSLDGNGDIEAEKTYRVCNNSIQYNAYDSIFTSKSGYKISFHFFNAIGERIGGTGYIDGEDATETNRLYYMPSGTYYKMLIVNKSESDPSAVVDVDAFVSNAVMKTAVTPEQASMYADIQSSLALNESRLLFGTFYVGNHTNGIPSVVGAKHICSLTTFVFPIKTRLDIKDGYQFAVNYFDSQGNYINGTGWNRSLEINANQKFRIVISEVPNTYTATEADIEPRVSAITVTGIPTEYSYSYDGNGLNLRTNGYNVSLLWTNATAWSDGINRSSQGIAVHNGVMFVGFASGTARKQKMRAFNAKTGELYGSFDIEGGHLGSLAFSDEYYDPSDDFPLLYSDDDVYPCQISVNRVTRTSAELVRTLVLDREHGGYYSKIALDNTSHRLWSIGQKTNDITQAGEMMVNAWDLDDLVDNGDGTYTPTLLPEFAFSIYDVFNQTATWLNGCIYYLLSSYTETRHTGILVINPYQKRVIADLEEWDSTIKNSEMEGIAFIPNAKGDKYDMLFTTHGFTVYRVQFS